jgi:hypothetical protein
MFTAVRARNFGAVLSKEAERKDASVSTGQDDGWAS